MCVQISARVAGALASAAVLASVAVLSWAVTPASAAPLQHHGRITQFEMTNPSYVTGERAVVRVRTENLDTLDPSSYFVEVKIWDPFGDVAVEFEKVLSLEPGGENITFYEWRIPYAAEAGIYSVTMRLSDNFLRDEVYDERPRESAIRFEVVAGPVLYLSSLVRDLGTVYEGDVINVRFRVTNSGDGGPLLWSVTDTPEWVTSVTPSSGNRSTTVKIEVDSKDVFAFVNREIAQIFRSVNPVSVFEDATPLSGSIRIESNGGDGEVPVLVQIPTQPRGEIVRPSAEQRSYTQGEPVTIPVEIENTGNIPIDYRVSLQIAGEYDSSTVGEDVLLSLDPKTSGIAEFTWDMPAAIEVGQYSVTARLEHWNEPDFVFDAVPPEHASSFWVDWAPSITASPGVLDLGEVLQGETAEGLVRVSNLDEQELEYEVVSIPVWLELPGARSGTTPGGVRVRISPSAEPGEHSGALVITTSGSSATVRVSATVLAAPNPTPSPSPEPTATPVATATPEPTPTPVVIPEPPTAEPAVFDPTPDVAAPEPSGAACSAPSAAVPLTIGLPDFLLLLVPLAAMVAFARRRR